MPRVWDSESRIFVPAVVQLSYDGITDNDSREQCKGQGLVGIHVQVTPIIDLEQYCGHVLTLYPKSFMV